MIRKKNNDDAKKEENNDSVHSPQARKLEKLFDNLSSINSYLSFKSL